MLALFFLYTVCISTTIFPSPEKLHQAFWGRYYEEENPDQALKWYQDLLDESDINGYRSGYKGVINLFSRYNDIGSILHLMPKIEHAFTDDVDIQLIFARALYGQGNVEAADAKIIQLSQRIKDNHELALLTAQMYMRKQELNNAIITLKEYLIAAPEHAHNSIFYFALAQMHMLLQETDTALQYIKKTLVTQPSFAKGWLLHGLLQEQNNQLDMALYSYTRYLALAHTIQPEIHMHVDRLAKIYNETLAQGTTTLNLNQEQLQRTINMIQQAQFQEAIKYIDRCLPEQCKTLLFDTKQQGINTQKQTFFDFFSAMCSNGIKLCKRITNSFINTLLPAKYITEPCACRIII